MTDAGALAPSPASSSCGRLTSDGRSPVRHRPDGLVARRHHRRMTDLRSRIRAGETLIGAFSDLASPLAAELPGQAGFDWIVLDLEHGAATEADLLGAAVRRRQRRR